MATATSNLAALTNLLGSSGAHDRSIGMGSTLMSAVFPRCILQCTTNNRQANPNVPKPQPMTNM
eukprot:5237714-Amphidinium_carterae.1